jgi:hypothetical protein
MCARFAAHFALIVASNGRRDLFFFLAAPAGDAETDASIQAIEPSVDYELSFVYDPGWRVRPPSMPRILSVGTGSSR